MKKETLAIRNQLNRTQYLEHSTPLFLTSSFVFEDAEDMRASFADEKIRNIYSRFSNPNVLEFVEKMVELENAEDGVAFATGMAAVYGTLATFLNSGDHIVSSSSIFGTTHNLFTEYFPRWNIETTYFNISELDSIESKIKPSTKIIFIESPTNPKVEVIDLEVLGNIAKIHNLLLVVDNTFSTPFIQNPIDYGANLVIHSATKFIDGQGRTLGGVTVGYKELINEIYLFSRNTGFSLSPFNAWILSKSLETLAIRIEKHSKNALKVAQFLEEHPVVKSVYYPFLASYPQYKIAKKQMKMGGSVISFELKGGKEAGKKFINSIKLFLYLPILEILEQLSHTQHHLHIAS